jgi:hypothetical protein
MREKHIQQSLASLASIVDEIKKCEIDRKLFLGDASV